MKGRSACRGVRVRIASEVCAAASASCACSPKRVSRLRFVSVMSRSRQRVFLLKSHRCLKFGAQFGPWMVLRESDRLLPEVPEVLYWHRFRH